MAQEARKSIEPTDHLVSRPMLVHLLIRLGLRQGGNVSNVRQRNVSRPMMNSSEGGRVKGEFLARPTRADRIGLGESSIEDAEWIDGLRETLHVG